MNDLAENPRAIIGSNESPIGAQAVTDQMARDYAELADRATTLLADARDLPDTVENDQDLGKVSGVVKILGDTSKRADAYRVKEKEVFLRGGQAVDGFFKGIMDRLDKTTVILHKRAHIYNARKEAEERARRQREAQEAAQRLAAARDEQDRIEREAREAALAAERARKPANVEAKQVVADTKAVEAYAARVETMMAADETDVTRLAAAQKPAELVRTRFEDGPMVTMKQVGYVEITDSAALDMAALWPFIKEDEKLKALRAWAKTVGFKKPMAGAIVELRNDTVIR